MSGLTKMDKLRNEVIREKTKVMALSKKEVAGEEVEMVQTCKTEKKTT